MKKANFCYAVLTASAVLTLGTVFSASAAQWQALGDEWVYVQNDGEYFKDGWKQDGNLYYYLGSDGIMLRRTLIEDDDNYYYLGSSGAMATNVWKFIQNPEWQGDELVGEGSWYYFGSNGKAIKSDGSKAKVYEVGDKKYVFDHYGRMMSGWVTESGEYVESEDDWANGLYYADGEGDGSVVTNAWVYTTVPSNPSAAWSTSLMREVWRSMDGTRATTAIGIGPTTEILKSLICVPDGSRRFLTLRCTPVPTTTAAYTGITPPAQERPQSLSSGPLMEKHTRLMNMAS